MHAPCFAIDFDSKPFHMHPDIPVQSLVIGTIRSTSRTQTDLVAWKSLKTAGNVDRRNSRVYIAVYSAVRQHLDIEESMPPTHTYSTNGCIYRTMWNNEGKFIEIWGKDDAPEKGTSRVNNSPGLVIKRLSWCSRISLPLKCSEPEAWR